MLIIMALDIVQYGCIYTCILLNKIKSFTTNLHIETSVPDKSTIRDILFLNTSQLLKVTRNLVNNYHVMK